MSEYSIFDIIGPIMIGPSSSHTAGANRIGYMAKHIIGAPIAKVNFYLHGSFAKTYKGHGTDKALLSGILGFLPDDERIRNAFLLADEAGLKYNFIPKDLGDVHPNTTLVEVETEDGSLWNILGSSIGAGKIEITRINEMAVNFTGEYHTLITHHEDFPGVVARITSALASHQINIAFMKLFRENKGSTAMLIIEADEPIDTTLSDELQQIKQIRMAKVIRRLV